MGCDCPVNRWGYTMHTINCPVTKDIAKTNKYCWICARKFWGNKRYLIEADGFFKVVHKRCAERGRFTPILPV